MLSPEIDMGGRRGQMAAAGRNVARTGLDLKCDFSRSDVAVDNQHHRGILPKVMLEIDLLE